MKPATALRHVDTFFESHGRRWVVELAKPDGHRVWLFAGSRAEADRLTKEATQEAAQ